MRVKSCLTGKRVVSLPFTAYCNPIIPKSQFENIVSFINNHNPGIDYIEIKLIDDSEPLTSELFVRHSHYVTHILNVDMTLDKLFKSFHNTSVRQRIKRAERKLTIRIAETEEEIKIFYKLFTAVRKKHGLPPQPYVFFKQMWLHLKPKDLLVVPLIEYDSKIIAAAMVLKFKDKYYFEYSASDQDYIKLCPNHMLIWETIKMAVRDKVKYFDFGRSSITNRSLIEFKERWSSKEVPLVYYYYPKTMNRTEDDGLMHRLLININRRLPNTLLKLEGKIVYSHIC